MSELPPMDRERGANDMDHLFLPADVLSFVRIERDILHESTYELIQEQIHPLLDSHGGLFRFHAAEEEHRIWVSKAAQHSGLDGASRIIHNVVRGATPGEPHFPRGETAEFRTLVVSRYPDLHHASYEKLHREHATAWTIPERSTYIHLEGEGLQLYGPRDKSTQMIKAANDLEDIREQISVLEYFQENVLGYCTELHQIKNPTLPEK